MALAPAAANTNDDLRKIRERIKQAAYELEVATAKVQRISGELQTVQRKLPAAKKKLSEARTRLQRAQIADREATAQVKAAQAHLESVTNQVKLTEAKLAATEQRIGQIARNLYIHGSLSTVEVVLESTDPNDFTQRLAVTQAYTRSQNSSLARLLDSQGELNSLRGEALRTRSEVSRLKAEARQKLFERRAATSAAQAAEAEVKSLIKRRQIALDDAEEDREAVKREYDELKEEQQRLEEIARRESRDYTGPEFTGEMLWPVAGAGITSRTGIRVHPIYGYRACHTGIDLGARTGTPISAAAAGRVAEVAYLSGYGNTVIITHGSGISTLYAHMSRFGASKGDQVAKGDTIGYIGSTGRSTGPHLHFEVRVDGAPYDPLGWFGGTKQRVSC
jgi:murein DD-endopeptidase MepM/ murein hydrolase activator NlpD